jgi:hypothetical protein
LSLDDLAVAPPDAKRPLKKKPAERPASSAESAPSATKLAPTPDRKKPATAGSNGKPTQSPAPAPESAQPARGLIDPEHLTNPITWMVGGACLLVGIGLIVWVATRSGKTQPSVNPEETAVEPESPDSAPPEPPPVEKSAKPAVADFGNTPETRLERLGREVLTRAEKDGAFPAAVRPGSSSPQAGFSWMADLAVTPDGPRPDWKRPWNDPINDRFVRRSLPQFQNPDVRQLAGEDGYPASHFVGVTGVGSDAAQLPVDHPRAGIFGDERRTKMEDIRDGASNTMLIAGTQQQLGSWASVRGATRAFTREPYVNGPDGFGTGHADSMLVVMADGSVRTVNRKTSPSVVRRMAAMADGLPLDPAVRGEPGEPAQNTEPEPPPAPEVAVVPAPAPPAPEVTPKVEPEKAPPKPEREPMPEREPGAPAPINPQLALDLKLSSIEQTKPVPLKDLLMLVEEMAGVPIEIDREKLGAAAARLDQEQTLKMVNPSLREILKKLLDQTGLDFQVDKECIRVIRRAR